MERDYLKHIMKHASEDFNSHAHVERDCGQRRQGLRNVHFNSHAHVERDVVASVVSDGTIISTHTLTWSVTLSNDVSLVSYRISTHTLTWSVTTSLGILANNGIISTHTLTWSVTKQKPIFDWRKFISTHTLTWSVTRLRYPLYGWLRISTHTLTWSVTLMLLSVVSEKYHFNSHAHVERDFSYFYFE